MFVVWIAPHRRQFGDWVLPHLWRFEAVASCCNNAFLTNRYRCSGRKLTIEDHFSFALSSNDSIAERIRPWILKLDVSAQSGPEGVTRSPTELKMRSVIIAFSVNIPTFPANRYLTGRAESMRPRAKSFIRSISQINYYRQKFSLSMTSEVRKCLKSAKSDRNSGFLHLAIKNKGVTLWDV